MKHFWALSSTLALSLALVVTGVVSWAGETSTPEALERDLTGTAADTTPDATAVGHSLFWQLAAPQSVVSGVHLMSRDQDGRGAQGTRSDLQFFEISNTGSNDVPDSALRAYRRAEMVMAAQDPDCQIPWTLLAAIGRVESNHGRFSGAQLGSDGVSRPEIRGPRLDGAGPFAAIADTDGGSLDRDALWDRAVGPMQFLPGTWRSVARDGDGDGRMNPDDLDDAAMGSAVYLCGAGGSLADPAGAARAAFRYNPSDYYVQLVLATQVGYQTGVFTEPTPPPPAPDTKAGKAGKAGKGKAGKAAKPQAIAKPRRNSIPKPAQNLAPNAGPKPAPKPAPGPAKAPKPTPGPASPTPTPAQPKRVALEGTWTGCSGFFCVAGTTLNLDRFNGAATDFDGDGAVEPTHDEFTGLVGQGVALEVEHTARGAVVYGIKRKGPSANRSSAQPSARQSAPSSARPSSRSSARSSAQPSTQGSARPAPTASSSPTTSAP